MIAAFDLKHYRTRAHGCKDAGVRVTQEAKAEHYGLVQGFPSCLYLTEEYLADKVIFCQLLGTNV